MAGFSQPSVFFLVLTVSQQRSSVPDGSLTATLLGIFLTERSLAQLVEPYQMAPVASSPDASGKTLSRNAPVAPPCVVRAMVARTLFQ